MSMESDLTALLKGLCPRVYPDVAPISTVRPYVTYQAIGGRSLRWLNGQPADKRHTMVQINVWSDTRLGALQLVRSIEDALCGATVFNAQPDSEPVSEHEPDLDLYGSRQDFSIYSAR